MKSYLNGLKITESGYVLLPHHSEQENEPLILDSVKQLWFKLHPSYDEVVFETESDVKSTGHTLEELQHFHDMSNKILPVIEDIDKMQDKERFLTREQKEKREERFMEVKRTNQGKIQSLQRQQEAHQRVGDENFDTSHEEYNIYNLKAALRIAKTLNSIRLIYPLLIRMLTHSSKLDTELKIGKISFGEKKQWMLGDHVFDIVTSKNVATIKCYMALVLKSLLQEDEVEDILTGDFDLKWECLISRIIRKERVSMNTPELLKLDENRMSEAMKHDKAILERIEGGQLSGMDISSFQKAVNNLMKKLEFVLGSRFKGCRLEVYGSCLSDLAIGKASDVDVSLYIPKLQQVKENFEEGELSPSKYAGEVKKFIFLVQKRLCDFGNDFSQLVAVTRARVPVIKGCYLNAQNPYTKDNSLAFDICFFNDIAIRNSTLLKEYTLVDPRAKDLMLIVKKWAKDHKISSAADDRLSSYAWVILVIFYLQQLGMLPNLQCTGLMKRANYGMDFNDKLNCINALNTAFVPWYQVQETKTWHSVKSLKNTPISVLLHGFFNYLLNDFPFGFYAVSIRHTNFRKVPKTAFDKCSLSFFCIEDPFETFESHCSHNLGNTVNLRGKELITDLLSKSVKNLESILVGKKESQLGYLWDPEMKKIKTKSTEKKAESEKKGRKARDLSKSSQKGHDKLTKGGSKPTVKKKSKHSWQDIKKQNTRSSLGRGKPVKPEKQRLENLI